MWLEGFPANWGALRQMLLRKLREKGEPEDLADLALSHGLDVEQTDDPRRLLAILGGGDELLTGQFQSDLLETAPPIKGGQNGFAGPVSAEPAIGMGFPEPLA